MLGRGLVGAAILVYLIVLGCVMLPSQAPAKKLSTEGTNSGDAANGGSPASRGANPAFAGALPFKGAAMQIQRVDWIDKYKQSIDEIASQGFDTVSLVLDTRQEDAESSRIYIDMRMTPTPEKLSELIQHAKGKGLRVILMPVVLLDVPKKDWRGVIRPEWWPDWFESYKNMLIHFAWIAQQNKVDVLSVGSELVSSEKERGEWTKVIRAVREVFKGQLTYSANWDHYTSIPFWDQLDLIGMNSYYKLGDDRNVKVEEVVSRWKEIQKDLLAFQRKVGKPILFLEIGWCSLENAAHEPWDYTKRELDEDPELQKKLYEGFFRAWYKEPGLGGFMVWEWTPGDGGKATAGPDGREPTKEQAEELRKGYTPENKPAQEVIQQWLAKPWK
ncbi:MAG TPA: hypothetical protein VER17_10925 [Tepidisphaeraceae bacterium]|nr:hypothetical protein [Tepidisphaeraceae bacterium]